MVRALIVALLLVPLLANGLASPGAAPLEDHPQVAVGPWIVSLDGPPTGEQLATLNEIGEVLAVYEVIDAALVATPPGGQAALAALPWVWRVDADEPLALHLSTSRPAVRASDAVVERGQGGNGVTVAVVDTGIDSAHPGVGAKVLASVQFTGAGSPPAVMPLGTDTDGHGTHVAGIVAGTGAQSQLLRSGDASLRGLAPEAALVALDISASFTTSTAIRAFDWVHANHEAYGIRVVQNSWGRQEVGRAFDPEDPAVRASSALVRDDGLLLVFSAANQGPAERTLSMEAMNPDVLTVGAVDDRGRLATFSSRGPVTLADGDDAAWTKPDIVAPGVRITSAASVAAGETSLYRDLSGTSQAAPHAAGVAALVIAANPALGPFDVMAALRSTAVDVGPPGIDDGTGFGLLDASAALAIVEGAERGSLGESISERYNASGRLVSGVDMEPGLWPSNTGVTTSSVSGTLPVKPGARALAFELTWEPGAPPLPGDTPTVVLQDPDGGPVTLTTSDGVASVRVERPTPGVWVWQARTEASMTTVTDYRMEAVVEHPVDLQRPVAAGFFDASPLERIWAQAQREDPLDLGGLSYLALAVLGLAFVLGLIGRVRR